MDQKSIELLYAANKAMSDLEDLVKEADMEHRVLSIMMFGVIPEEALDEDNESETVEMKSSFHFNVQSEEELESLINAIRDAYNKPDDLDDLLNNLGLSLN